jgi:FkbM family methyltransferase
MNITETADVWDNISSCGKPVYIYGMGNGADKILDILRNMGVSVSGVFASDDFVRGQSFRGFTVKKLSDIEAVTDDFIIVLAFGSDRPDVISHIEDAANRHTLYAPDIPVCGGGLFTRSYFEENRSAFERVYDLLEDEWSRSLYENVINFKLSGNIAYLLNENSTDLDDIFGSLPLSDNEIFADLGAYTGDTAAVFERVTDGRYREIHAFEPQPKTFKRLLKNTKDMKRITCHNAAVWSESGSLSFSGNDNRNSSLFGGFEEKSVTVQTLRVDEVLTDVTLIKLDVEGAEEQALTGAKTSLKSGAKLLCAVYHRNDDLYKLPLLINAVNPRYHFKLRRVRCLPAWDCFLCAYIN